MLTPEEFDRLETAARRVPAAANRYLTPDAVIALLETVIDYQQNTVTVERAMGHFVSRRAAEIRTVDDLERTLDRSPDDKPGNLDLATYLWGYRLWTRAQQLRGLVRYFTDMGIRDLEGMRRWAATSRFAQFEGRVKGLGPAVYDWLVMRLGVETVKPDVRLMRFVGEAIGRPVSETETVEAVTEVAHRLGVKANELDWAAWEHMGR